MNVASKDSTSALSELLPIVLMDWRTPAWRQASAKARLVCWDPWPVCLTDPARLGGSAWLAQSSAAAARC
ncbi:hypothetical protein ACFU6S_39480 [Streptomyces sp. NPDC057456]|uniref:hypothetical protein n=1 Tax=Streptomyces sp. NPDC057456 TaxID=3346139 RepID=UPI00367ABF87